MRLCVHCGKEIPREVMIRGRWKAIFCSSACRANDKTTVRAYRNAYRQERGACVVCGHKSRSAREQMQTAAIPHGRVSAARGIMENVLSAVPVETPVEIVEK